jgi:hypothetical protein
MFVACLNHFSVYVFLKTVSFSLECSSLDTEKLLSWKGVGSQYAFLYHFYLFTLQVWYNNNFVQDSMFIVGYEHLTNVHNLIVRSWHVDLKKVQFGQFFALSVHLYICYMTYAYAAWTNSGLFCTQLTGHNLVSWIRRSVLCLCSILVRKGKTLVGREEYVIMFPSTRCLILQRLLSNVKHLARILVRLLSFWSN